MGRSTATPAGTARSAACLTGRPEEVSGAAWTARRGSPSLLVRTCAGVATPDPRTVPPRPSAPALPHRTRAGTSTPRRRRTRTRQRTLQPAATHDLEIDTLLTSASGGEAGVIRESAARVPGVADVRFVDVSERRICRVDASDNSGPSGISCAQLGVVTTIGEQTPWQRATNGCRPRRPSVEAGSYSRAIRE